MFAGETAGKISKDIDFGLTYKVKNVSFLKGTGRTLLFSSSFLKQDSLKNCNLVISVSEKDKNVVYHSHNLEKLIASKNKWEQVNLMHDLPSLQSEENEIAIFIWNHKQNELFVDDFEIKIY